MANRDYFIRPIQGNGRDFPGYGNTHLHRKPEPRDPWMTCTLIAAVAIAVYFIWQFSR